MRTCPTFLVTVMVYWILLLRARVLNHNPRVKGLQFKTRSGKNSETSQLSGLSARKFRRWSLTCVDEAINLSLCLMSSFCLNPFFNGSMIGQLWPFLFCQWGVSARSNGTLRSPNKVIVFLGSKPSPFLNFLWTFSSRLISSLLFSSARVGTTFEFALRRVCDWPLFKSLGNGLVCVRGPALRSIQYLREGREPEKKLKTLLIG